MRTVQCDVCCPPAQATNAVTVLREVGWRLSGDGAEFDACPACVRDRRWLELPLRSERGDADAVAGGRLPDLLLIGAAKAGTTSLHAYLDSHPEISMATLKELRFFTDPEYQRWLPWYRAQFAFDSPMVGESSTMYTRAPAMPGVPERIAATVPDARLIYMVRDPVARAVASYQEERFQLMDPRPIEEAFADLADPYNPYLAASRYAEQLSGYLEHFGTERILVIPLDDLEAEPDATMRRVFGFLGVGADHVVDTSRRLNQASAKYEYGGMARRLRRGVAGRLVQRLPDGARDRVQAGARRLLSSPLERPELSSDLEAALQEALAPDAARFRELTGLALPNWSV
jgi:hypothetical protein